MFEPHGRVHSNVLMIGAVAVPQRFYASFARHLARAGHRVLTFDYRGVGSSRPDRLRGFTARLSHWVELDYPAALTFLLDHYGEIDTFAVGHSLGGQSVALTPRADVLKGVVAVASQSGYYGNFENPWKMALLWRGLMPGLTRSFGYLPGFSGTGEDLPRGVAEEWASWCLSPSYFLGAHPEYRAPMAHFQKPMLMYSFSDDDYAPLVNVRWLQARYESALIEHRHLDPRELNLDHVGHMGFFRDKTSALWSEVVDFFGRCLTHEEPVMRTYRHRHGVNDNDNDGTLRIDETELLADLAYGRG